MKLLVRWLMEWSAAITCYFITRQRWTSEVFREFKIPYDRSYADLVKSVMLHHSWINYTNSPFTLYHVFESKHIWNLFHSLVLIVLYMYIVCDQYIFVNPTCRFSLLTDMSNTNQYWTLSLSDHFWGQSIIYLGTRHQIGYRVGITTVKLLKVANTRKY